MPQTKYPKLHEEGSVAPIMNEWAPFDLGRLGAKTLGGRIAGGIARKAFGPAYAVFRRFKPVASIGGMIHIARDEQVRDILGRPQDFPVPFGPEMRMLGEGATFMLGLDGAEHERFHRIMAKVLLRDDAEMMRVKSAAFSAALLEGHSGSIDVINGLIKRVPAEICVRYFGLDCQDTDSFADWTLAISAMLFGDPAGEAVTRELAMQGARKMSALIDDAIGRIRQHVLQDGDRIEDATTLVHRLLIVQQNEQLSDAEIRALLIGTASGFVPTNTLAAANMLAEIFDRPNAMKHAREAALQGDRDLMRKVLLEAGRLNPTLSPGQWRYCPDGAKIDVGGKPRAIPPQSTLLVSTMSAMRDPRAWDDPAAFRIDRAQEPDLLFGHGPHFCIGKELAIAQISGVFGELFGQSNLRRARGKEGRLRYLGFFPRHWQLDYNTPSSEQSMFLIVAPVVDGSSYEEMEERIAKLGRPAEPVIRDALDSTDILHFASIHPQESERGLDIIIELNCDGTADEAIRVIADAADDQLKELFQHTHYDPDHSLANFMLAHKVEIHGKIWGATGLKYNGLGEFSVARIEKQRRFADFAGRTMRDFVATETARGSHPMLALGHMRRILRQDPVLRAIGTDAQQTLMDEAEREGFDAFHIATDAMRLKLARYEQPASHARGLVNFLKSKDSQIMTVPMGLVMLAVAAATWFSIGGSILSKLVLSATVGLVGGILINVLLFALFFAAIRWTEKRDKPFTERASLEHMRKVLKSEDLPGYAQNHVYATANLKSGWFRTFLHCFALWGVKQAVVHWYRPGFVNGMGTIHYARWYKLPGTRRAIFYSNFDGSWESYLEDFITRVHEGQSATWSNWEGFPETRYLIAQGAQNSDAFKNYARLVQRVAPFWYARFPELTSDQVRANGQIHMGASLASTSTEAEEWLRHFGSRARHKNLVEADEVQGLVFRGMKTLPYSKCLAVQMPPAGEKLGEWLCWLRGKPMQIDGLLADGAEEQIAVLMQENILDRVPRPAGRPGEYALAQALTITYGDRPLLSKRLDDKDDASTAMQHAAFLGISAAGLVKFEAPNTPSGALQEGMPYSFRMGMGGRGQILGDPRVEDRDWRWDDAVDGDAPVEAALMIYAASPEALERMNTIHRALLTNHGGKVVHQVDCAPAWEDNERIDFEHFGFRDGISQPVLRGLGRTNRGVPERDLLEPGEFIIGYKNESGYYPTSPQLPAEADARGALPVSIDNNLSRYTDFGGAKLADAPRDLGRNGTFLVLRELKQDVEGFHSFADEAAERLAKDGFGDLYKVVGQNPDADWIKAKIMGRWADGRPLVGHPVNHNPEASQDLEERENDFNFGDDDPQGLACPFASHIRRTNPRESKKPDDEIEQDISNRHRILRRGRPYTRKDDAGNVVEKGLLFGAICTDLERQFEFVQQFWCNAPAFHGLDNEPDPISGADSTCTRTGDARPRHFSIPTGIGPIRLEGLQNFVEMMGGGYFFMPSRSALSWLSDTALYAPRDDVEAGDAQ